MNNILLEQSIKTEKKVDFRYYNLTRSLQDINGVIIETKEGRVINTLAK